VRDESVCPTETNLQYTNGSARVKRCWVEVNTHTILTSVLGESDWSALGSGHFSLHYPLDRSWMIWTLLLLAMEIRPSAPQTVTFLTELLSRLGVANFYQNVLLLRTCRHGRPVKGAGAHAVLRNAAKNMDRSRNRLTWKLQFKVQNILEGTPQVPVCN
jgi:hypothetical protein